MSIDLEQKDSYPELATSESSKRKYYPSFHYSGDELDLPDSGEMTVTFKVIERTESDRDGKKTCRYTVEVREILSVDDEDVDDSPTKSYDEAGDALDKIAEALSKKG